MAARRAPQAPIGGVGNARNTLVNPVGGSARVDSGGAGLMAGAEAVAVFAQIGHAQDVQRDNLTAAKLQEEFKLLTAEAVAQLDPLSPDYRERVEEVYQTARDSAIQNGEFKTRKVQDAFGVALEAQSTGGLVLAEAGRRTALDKEGKRLRGQVEDSTYASIRRDPDGFDAYLAEFATQAGRVNTAISPADLPAMNAKFADTALIARAEGYAEQGRFTEAKGLIEGHQSQLNPETYRSAKRMIREQETQQKQNILSSTAAAIADVEVKIVDAKTNADFTTLRAQVERMDTGGLFRGREEKKVSMIRQIEHQREIIARQEQYVAVRLDQFDRGAGLNNQSDADVVWEHVAAKHRAANPEAGSDQWVSWAGQYAAQSGWVPSQFRNVMVNSERTDNPELVETGARLYDRFRALAPEADLGVRDSGSRVRLVSASRELLGVDYKEATSLVMSRVPDEATLKARSQGFDKEFKDFDSRKALVSAGIATDGWFSSPDKVPESVARAYEKTLRLHYDLMGDKAIAEAAANKRFKEEYGVSAVGGVKTVIRLPPENFFPGAANTSLNVDQKAKVIDEDLTAAFKKLGVEPGTVVATERDEYVWDADGQLVATGKKIKADGSGIAPYSLAADRQTEQDRVAGRPASFEVRVRNSFGVQVPVPVEQGGTVRNMRYVMPTTEQLSAMPAYQVIAREAEMSARNRKDIMDNVVKPDMRRYPYGPKKEKK